MHRRMMKFIGNFKTAASALRPKLTFYLDIAANMTDPMYRGLYRGKQAHAGNFQNKTST